MQKKRTQFPDYFFMSFAIRIKGSVHLESQLCSFKSFRLVEGTACSSKAFTNDEDF